jgi:hypothetical protein
MLADQAKEAGSGPMRPGDGMCDLRQRWKGFSGRRFKSEVQQGSIDGMAE